MAIKIVKVEMMTPDTIGRGARVQVVTREALLTEYPVTPKPPKEFSFLTIGKRGRPSKGQEKVTMRLDPDVLAKFRATGEGWQGRINEILKEAKP